MLRWTEREREYFMTNSAEWQFLGCNESMNSASITIPKKALRQKRLRERQDETVRFLLTIDNIFSNPDTIPGEKTKKSWRKKCFN